MRKKTLIELYQDCKRKQELKEFMARLNNIPDGYLLCDGIDLYLNKYHFLDNINEDTNK